MFKLIDCLAKWMAPHLVNRYDKINMTVTEFFSSAESAPKMYLLQKINTCNKV